MPILRIWPKITLDDENDGNTARFCVKVVVLNKLEIFGILIQSKIFFQ